MAHTDYTTDAVVAEVRDTGEAGALVLLFTRQHGTLWARAEGVKKLTSKLIYALQVGTHVSVRLLRGKSGWRIIGASEKENYYYQSKEEKNYFLFRFLVRVMQNVKRFLQSETPEQILFDDLITLMKTSFEETDISPELLVDALFMLRLGYLSFEEKLAADSPTEAVVKYVQKSPLEVRKAVETAVKASHL